MSDKLKKLEAPEFVLTEDGFYTIRKSTPDGSQDAVDDFDVRSVQQELKRLLGLPINTPIVNQNEKS